MSKRKTYYKVVAVRSSGLYSYCHSDLFFIRDESRNSYSVEYKLNEFVTPNVTGTKLYVFDNVDNAKRFAGLCETVELWECEVINPRKCATLAYVLENSINKFWKLKRAHKKINAICKQSPYGTISCDAVKLLRKVL